MKRSLLAITILSLFTASARAGSWSLSVDIGSYDFCTCIISNASAAYAKDYWWQPTATVSGTHSIYGNVTTYTSGSGAGSWNDTLQAGREYSTYYTAYIDAREDLDGTSQGLGTYTLFSGNPPPPQCTLQVDWTTGGYATASPSAGRVDCGTSFILSAVPDSGYRFIGWCGDITSSDQNIQFTLTRDMIVTAQFEIAPAQTVCNENSTNPECSGRDSPIVFDVGTGGYHLSSLDDAVAFDVDADGNRDRVSWTAAQEPMAFLTLDRNNNGIIDNGAELFGNHSPLESGLPASNGFVALAEYDANRDGAIDARDAIWTSLLLWTDRNHDGVSQPDELQFISKTSITKIDLTHHWTGRIDANGNVFRYESQLHIGNTVRPFYDIYFRVAP